MVQVSCFVAEKSRSLNIATILFWQLNQTNIMLDRWWWDGGTVPCTVALQQEGLGYCSVLGYLLALFMWRLHILHVLTRIPPPKKKEGKKRIYATHPVCLPGQGHGVSKGTWSLFAFIWLITAPGSSQWKDDREMQRTSFYGGLSLFTCSEFASKRFMLVNK